MEQSAQEDTVTETGVVELSYEECLHHLRAGDVARLGVIHNDFPLVLPVNYRVVETVDLTWFALRTRVGNTIERAPMPASLEIGEVDTEHHSGWAVLVRGTLHHVDPDAADFRERFDPEPWLTDERDAWMVVQPFWIGGRRLLGTSDPGAIADLGVIWAR
jgi:nitroimidazol reductase NimA-like FMN-containing flavoprotein (pyridoxamine 5'-phosphate oxidase superfamily)